MWYVIQTTTGKEQELVDAIKKIVPGEIYKDCFLIKRELLKRLGGEWVKVTETLFPSYVFVDTEDVERLFFELKRIPEFAKILGNKMKNCAYEFCGVEEEEREFLAGLFDEDYRIKITRVLFDSAGNIAGLEGPLNLLERQIERMQLRKRYAVVHMMLSGEVKTTHLGIEF